MNYPKLSNTTGRDLSGRTKGDPMKKPMLLIQLIVNDSAVWQVNQDVDRKFCRNMTQPELEAIGAAAALELESVVSKGKTDAEVPGPNKAAKRK